MTLLTFQLRMVVQIVWRSHRRRQTIWSQKWKKETNGCWHSPKPQDSHESQGILCLLMRTFMHTRAIIFLPYKSLTSFRSSSTRGTITCSVCENFHEFWESWCYENNVCTRRLTHKFIHEDDDIVHVHCRHYHFYQCLTFFSPNVVAMSTSRPLVSAESIGRQKNSAEQAGRIEN